MYNELNADYCFVFGCPRSGTTILGQLLHSHQAVAMGIERYKYLLRLLERDERLDEFTPDLFEPARFFEFREGDTNVAPPGFAKHYRTAEKRLEKNQLRVIGDKVMPPTEPIMQAIEAQFPDPKFVFIYRDLLRVASSYAVRAGDPEDHWPAENDYQVALEQWNEAFDVAEHLIERAGSRVFVVNYDGFFDDEGRGFRSLLAFLGLEPTPKSLHRFENTVPRWKKVQTKPLALSPEQQQELLGSIDVARVERFDALFAASVARFSTPPQAAAVG